MWLLSTKDLDAILEGSELLGASLAGLATEDELGVELPAGGELPGLGDLLVDQGAVVLEVGTKTLSLEGRPEDELLHGETLRREQGELVGVGGELGLHALDDGLVVEEEDGAGGALEHGHALRRVLPLVLGDDLLEGVGGDVPQLLVLGAEQDDEAVGLGVEGRGRVQGGLVDNLLDARRGDGQLLGQGVVGAAVLDELEEEVGGDLGGGHCVGVVVFSVVKTM